MNFAFDVDGTLTKARQQMDSNFKRWFLEWMEGRNVYLVTGSDRDKTVEQIGADIVDNVTMSFQCAGNSIWRKGVEVASTHLNAPAEMFDFLEEQVAKSSYPEKYGNHIEVRTGLINFSVVGRNAVGDQRDNYYAWDQEHEERKRIAELFNKTFTGFEAELGGNTSLDIHLKGRNKAQVYDVIGEPLIFVGDRMHEGGNDLPLAKRMTGKNDKAYPVSGPAETWALLLDNYND